LGVTAGDLLILVPASAWITAPANNWCVLLAATATPPSLDTIEHSANAWNNAATFPTSAFGGNAYLLNMGALSVRTYAINKTTFNLQTTDGPASSSPSAQDVFPQIVNFRALYGKDTNNDGTIDIYDNTTPTTNAGWLQVRAIRIAIVSRSNQYEKEAVTDKEPQWNVGKIAVAGVGVTAVTCNKDSQSNCINLPVVAEVGSASDDPPWKHYRYQVYDTVVPLRNALWGLTP
jgi:type IV pilus assembly protein PilW